MNKEHVKAERKTLVLSLLAGLCGNAVLAGLTASHVSFSLFPLIAFGLAIYCLYQEYLSKPLAEGTAPIAFACFLAGAFGYSAFMRAQYPEAGSNFFLLLVTMSLLIWIAYKMGIVDRPESSDMAEQK